MRKPRDYEPMLALAEQITGIRGYQNERDRSGRAALERKFRKAQFAFAYREIRRDPDPTSLRAAMVGDLQRNRAGDAHSPEAVAYVREQLIAEMPRLLARHPLQLHVRRWVPAAILLAASAGKLYFLAS